MKTLTTFAALLVLAAGVAGAAPSADLAPAGDYFHNWHDAVVASGLSLDHPIELEMVTTEAGIAEYRMQSLESGEIAYARVRLPVDPALQPEEAGSLAERNCAPESTRCDPPLTPFNLPSSSRCNASVYKDANFSGSVTPINLDFNSLRYQEWFGGAPMNDSISSIKTTCTAAYFFQHKNWSGTALYVPANTSLSTISLNDQISSLWHVIP